MDGAAGAAPDGRDVRQEHDQQGRVPADGRDGDALHRHDQPPLARARPRRGPGLLDHRQQRGGDARRARDEAPLAGGAARRGQAGRPTEHRDGDQRPGLLGEVRAVLGRGAADRPDGGHPVPHRPGRRGGALRREHDRRRRDHGVHVRRLLRARREGLPRARPAAGGDRARHPRARGRRVGWVRRAVHRSADRVGLPPEAGRLDQRLRPQVRPRRARRGLGDLAGGGVPAGGPDLPGQLPRRHHADVRPELLPPRRPGGRAVLQLHPAGLQGLPAGPAVRARRGARPRARDRPARAVRAGHDGRGPPGLRVQGPRRDHELQRLRRLRRRA